MSAETKSIFLETWKYIWMYDYILFLNQVNSDHVNFI